MSRLFLHVSFLILLVLSACVSIPHKHLYVSQRDGSSVVQDAIECNNDHYKYMSISDPAQNPELDSRGFNILTWNVFKGMKEGWKVDFKKLAPYYDIITIQEARLTDELREMLNTAHSNWDISIAFTYNGKETGVLTASRITPEFICMFRMKEQLVSLPKTTMVTVYPVSNTDKTLMVVNMHSVNFTFGSDSFNRQLQKVENILSQHYGPVILSGDFNTWSNKRMATLRDLSIRLDLKAVPFNKQDRTRVFGHAIDHIYYRELSVIDAAAIKVTSSDHNPMRVSFKLEK